MNRKDRARRLRSKRMPWMWEYCYVMDRKDETHPIRIFLPIGAAWVKKVKRK